MIIILVLDKQRAQSGHCWLENCGFRHKGKGTENVLASEGTLSIEMDLNSTKVDIHYYYKSLAQNFTKILAYQKKWPINWFEHRDEIIKRRGDVYNKFFEYVLRNTSEIYLKKINELEDKAEKKLADAKKINPDFFKSKSDVDPSYFSNKFELFKEASKEIESNQLIKILREIDKHNEWEEKNYQARLAAIAKSKFLFFTNMSTKEKLKIKSYNKMHLKCENEYNRGQITFIQTWK